MNFASDNWAGAASEINEALTRNSAGNATAYGDSELDHRVYQQFSEIFETNCTVFFTGTGTAANTMAFACSMKPGGVSFCHSEAHMIANEGGAGEFLSGGGRIIPVGGSGSKIDPDQLAKALMAYPKSFNHLGQGVLVSITQSTEGGTCYDLEEIAKISQISKGAGLPLHMDGARFANAMMKLGCSPADMTWKSGVDMVSFGGTKKGCWCAEALVIFNQELAEQAHFIRKKMGHLFSTSRFISSQFEAYFEGGLWKKLAKHSNNIGLALQEMIREHDHARLAWESDTNQVFMIADRKRAENWLSSGAHFYPFPAPRDLESEIGADEQVYRLVTSFISTEEEVEALRQLMAK